MHRPPEGERGDMLCTELSIEAAPMRIVAIVAGPTVVSLPPCGFHEPVQQTRSWSFNTRLLNRYHGVSTSPWDLIFSHAEWNCEGRLFRPKKSHLRSFDSGTAHISIGALARTGVGGG